MMRVGTLGAPRLFACLLHVIILTHISSLWGNIASAELPKACRSAPYWAQNIPDGFKYDYYVGYGSHENKDKAREAALHKAMKSIALSGRITIKTYSSIEECYEQNNGQTNECLKVTDKVAVKATTQVREGLQPIRQWEKPCNNGKWEARVLLRTKKTIPRPGGPPNHKVLGLLPGASQFAKRQHFKGSMIIAGEAALIGTSILFGLRANNSFDEASNPRIRPEKRAAAQDKGDQERLVAILAGAGALGLWVINYIDAIATKDNVNFAQTESKTPTFTAGIHQDAAWFGVNGRF